MTLGLRIRTLRKARKMTQQQLADVTQVSRIYIQALESNRRSPSMKLLHRLSEQLGVETSDLLEEFPRDTGGRLQLEELFSGPEPMEIWYRSHKLSEKDMAMVQRLIEAALMDWEGDGKRAKKGAKR
ncbi:MAG: helix-turn-helix transcriptional regulator [Pyramidobacter sp.]|nr:helix-turn-helix transcriptional regulator [Pyramidobacter sp.]MBP3751104.1 helix-turn-helix transcriptional regulator [Pyramidobacter sp.]MBP3836090.1 helix-turn-helix transcriptional regulator [Pyramidobacter sp.]MBP3849042.1 helix-turn-helix transcriptional regulator [Pyramidobacter sp.]MBQ8090894.1 helix-turn-helix transcriptional regulator [Pyramidobacter sp.]